VPVSAIAMQNDRNIFKSSPSSVFQIAGPVCFGPQGILASPENWIA
jgi:hypothetical protein